MDLGSRICSLFSLGNIKISLHYYSPNLKRDFLADACQEVGLEIIFSPLVIET
jgi:hypothetical protein